MERETEREWDKRHKTKNENSSGLSMHIRSTVCVIAVNVKWVNKMF